MAKKDKHSPSFILDSVKQDKIAQEERDEMLKSAVAFIVELCEHAGAFGEALPRGYRVVIVKGRKEKNKEKTASRIELRHQLSSFWGRSSPLKVAVIRADAVELLQVKSFIKHINDNLIDEIGCYFVERYQRNRRETARLSESLQSVDTIRSNRKRDFLRWIYGRSKQTIFGIARAFAAFGGESCAAQSRGCVY